MRSYEVTWFMDDALPGLGFRRGCGGAERDPFLLFCLSGADATRITIDLADRPSRTYRRPTMDTEKAASVLTAQVRDSEDDTEECGPRSNYERHTKSAINSGLGLSYDDEYRSLYAKIEQWLTDRNLISQTHRVISSRRRVQEQFSTHLAQSYE
jgi:hypothetical protein